MRPTSPESRQALHELREAALARGDDSLAVILGGVELYVSLGREFELIEGMRSFAEEMRDSIENTPSAADLQRLYDDESGQS